VETEELENPWHVLAELIEAKYADGVRAFLEGLGALETARVISRLDAENQTKLLLLLDPGEAASLLEGVSDTQAADLIEQLPVKTAAAILDEIRSDQQADLLAQIPSQNAEAILSKMSPEEAVDARRLLEYPKNTAGGIMLTEYLAYPGGKTIGQVVADLESHRGSYADYTVQYLYVVDSAGKLKGVLRMRDLVFSASNATLAEVMIREPLSLQATASTDEVRAFFEGEKLLGAPVVADDGRLIGVVTRSAVRNAASEHATRQFLGISGIVGGEEFRSMPLMVRSGRRLSWLTINIVLNIVAASVIAAYTDTLSAAIMLAVFLPMISDMSGCSGNQAVAVSMRELSLGLVRPSETWRVFGKEASLGIINGLVLGALLGAVAMIWTRNPYLGLVVGVALAANTVLAVCLGGLLPLVLKRIKLDPALVSGPLLTTVTDMCGFFLVLSLATLMLSKLH